MKPQAFFGGLALLLLSGPLLAACPDYLQGEYRQLHSTKDIDLCKLTEGKPVLVVNTASLCGNTPQYTDLERIYEQYHDKGFEVLAFPANNFGQQEPGTNAEIKGFCLTKYSVSFPLFSKISVKGPDKHPLYHYLTEQSPFPGEVEWNFQKYLVDRSGNVVGRFHHRTKPVSPEVVKEIERVLQQ